MHFLGQLADEMLSGTIINSEGEALAFKGVRAPKPIRNAVNWSKPVLFLTEKHFNWKPFHKKERINGK